MHENVALAALMMIIFVDMFEYLSVMDVGNGSDENYFDASRIRYSSLQTKITMADALFELAYCCRDERLSTIDNNIVWTCWIEYECNLCEQTR